MTHGKTYNKSPRRTNHKATESKTNTALERSAICLPSVHFVIALLYLSDFPFGVGVLMWIWLYQFLSSLIYSKRKEVVIVTYEFFFSFYNRTLFIVKAKTILKVAFNLNVFCFHNCVLFIHFPDTTYCR